MKVTDWLSPEEIRSLTERSDARAWLMVALNWGIIGGTLALVARWPGIVSALVAVFVLGGRQLGLGILMHEAGHQTLFRTRALNQWVGGWLCAYPVLGDLEGYAESHHEHHRHAGSEQDPDLPNYRAYPVEKDSFRRKVIRDLTGQTGLRNLRGLFSGSGSDIMMREGDGSSRLREGLIANAVLFALLLAAGIGWTYALWVLAYLTTYPLCARIRQLAEHGSVEDLFHPDPRLHTRTTLANPLERLVLCPNHVNYHLEHHFMAGIPAYRLPQAHGLLAARGFFDGHETALARGYREVLHHAIRSPSS